MAGEKKSPCRPNDDMHCFSIFLCSFIFKSGHPWDPMQEPTLWQTIKVC